MSCSDKVIKEEPVSTISILIPHHQEIHQRALEVAKRYRQVEIDLIEVLQQVDRYRIYYKHDCNSLFQYAVNILKLSENVAYVFIGVARKAREVPALKEEIRHGRITVSKAKKVISVLNQENQEHWLNLAKSATKRELEKQVALTSPKKVITEKLQYVHRIDEIAEKVKVSKLRALSSSEASSKEVRVQLQVGLTEKLMLQLRRVQDLISQKKKQSAGLEEVIGVITSLYLDKHDPVARAKRQQLRGKLDAPEKLAKSEKTEEQLVPGPAARAKTKSVETGRSRRRRPLPAAVRHRLNLKYKGRCAHTDEDGKRCSSGRFLEIHHIKPLSLGGTDELNNLILLCAGHHRSRHCNL